MAVVVPWQADGLQDCILNHDTDLLQCKGAYTLSLGEKFLYGAKNQLLVRFCAPVSELPSYLLQPQAMLASMAVWVSGD